MSCETGGSEFTKGDNPTAVQPGGRSSRHINPDHYGFQGNTAISVKKVPLSVVEALNGIEKEKWTEVMGNGQGRWRKRWTLYIPTTYGI